MTLRVDPPETPNASRPALDACVSAFLAALPALLSETRPSDALLGAALADALSAARTRWPEVEVDEPAFCGYLAERLVAGESVLSTLHAMHTDDLYLAHACVLGSPVALRTLEQSFLARLGPALARLCNSREQIDESVQRVREHLLVPPSPGEPIRLTRYSGEGLLWNWICVTAVRLTRRLVWNGVAAPVSLSDVLAVDFEAGTPESELIRSQLRDLLQNAVRDALANLSPEDRTLLRHCYIDNLSVDAIAGLYRLHRASVYRRLTSVRGMLFAATREAVAKSRGFGDSTLDSIMRLAAGDIDLSIADLL